MKMKCSEITAEMLDVMVKTFLEKQQSIQSLKQKRPKRVHNMPSGFDDFVVTETIPGDQEKRSYLQVYIESLDLLNVEFESRFSSENVLLWEAMSPLSPASNHY